MVMLTGDAPRQLRQLDRRPEQAGEPVLQLLIECLRLRRTDVVGPGAVWREEQQAQRNKTKQAHGPALHGVIARQGYRVERSTRHCEPKLSTTPQRFIITGRLARSSTCRVTPPRMSWRRRECE